MHPNKDHIKIEFYRKFDIYFDKREETFFSISDYYDTQVVKKTYTAAKKAIDEYIKENNGFKPFFLIDCRGYGTKNEYNFPISHEIDKITVTGIRKDKRFVYNESEQIGTSQYDQDKLYILLPENEPVFEELKPLIEEREIYKRLERETLDRIIQVSKKLKLVNLAEYRKTIEL
tara:strand:+ start:12078 stop:12599 length:522 start_codon:yes stop_codon:yes gene_type:complete